MSHFSEHDVCLQQYYLVHLLYLVNSVYECR